MCSHHSDLILKDEVYAIVGAAMEVSNVLGAGFLEAVYQEALAMEFSLRQIPFEAQALLSIDYKGSRLAKDYIADFFCFDQIVVEIKATKRLTSIEEAQLLNYLKATGKPLGLLLNFGVAALDWKRLVLTP